ncbi:hypothetical protein GCM10022419_056380 [Nonomuraea rosea]|uniref:Uncharacterized protein n=1 Tax=Nonomuraea rosea TaxID=638574 RepID=A0ABP6XJY8_9ACTN
MHSPATTPDDIKAAPTTPPPTRRLAKWLHYAAINRERGMSTAEYAVGTIVIFGDSQSCIKYFK